MNSINASSQFGAPARVLLLAIVAVLAACAASPQGPQVVRVVQAGGSAQVLDVFNCAKPDGEKVCIVLDTYDCPVYTVYRGVLDAMPVYNRADGPVRMKWQAVHLQPPVNPGDPNVYTKADVEYEILFEPFKPETVTYQGDGKARSKKLGCKDPANPGNTIPPDQCLPGGIQFKYTIWRPNSDCDPLDPLVRVN